MPTGLMVSATTMDSITWTWTAVEGATAYEVQLSADEVFDDTDPIVRVQTNSFTVSGLSGAASAYVRVRVVAGTAETPVLSAWSSHVAGMSAVLPPPVPTGLHISATTPDSITWTWTAVAGATGYEVQQSLDEVFDDTDPIVRVQTNSFTVSGLSGVASAYVRVRAVAGTAEAPILSAWSSHVAGMSAVPPPPVPTGLHVSATTPDSITWTWTAVAGATGYEVQQSLDEVFDDTDPIVRVQTTDFTVSGLSGATNAYVRVRAVAGTAEAPILSAWSSHVTGLTRTPPLTTVFFVGESRRVTEGETIEIQVEVSGHASEPLRIQVAAEHDTVVDADYELLTSVLEIPPSGVSDTMATITLRALEDDYFAEGDETLWLRLGASQESAVEFGPRLALTINDAGVSPCDGIRVRGEPVSSDVFRNSGLRSGAVRVRLMLETDSRARRVAADWISPYDDYRFFDPERRAPDAEFNVVVEDWSYTTEGSTARQLMAVVWNPEEQIGLRFRSEDGACAAEPTLVCTGEGCELRR